MQPKAELIQKDSIVHKSDKNSSWATFEESKFSQNTFGKNIYCFLQQTDYLSPMIRADAMNALCRFFSSG